VECSSVVCSLCAIAAAVPPRPQDGTVSVIVLFTIVFGCVTDCNGARVTDLFVKYHLKLHIDITLHHVGTGQSSYFGSGRGREGGVRGGDSQPPPHKLGCLGECCKLL